MSNQVVNTLAGLTPRLQLSKSLRQKKSQRYFICQSLSLLGFVSLLQACMLD